MKPHFVLVTAFFAACAAPDSSTIIGTAKGPDLGNFVEYDDLSTSSDLAIKSIDLGADQGAQSLPDFAMATAHDMAMASSPPDMAMSSGCGSVTYQGSCKSNTLTYCYNNKVTTLKCTGGEQCTTVSGDSNCRYVNGSSCGTVDEDGVCAGDTLAYCDDSSNTLSVTDCSTSGLSCVVDFTGFADCE